MPRLLLILSLLNVFFAAAQPGKKGVEKHVQVLMAGNFKEDPEARRTLHCRSSKKRWTALPKSAAMPVPFMASAPGRAALPIRLRPAMPMITILTASFGL